MLEILLDEVLHRSFSLWFRRLWRWSPDRWEDARFPSHPQRLAGARDTGLKFDARGG